MIMDEDAEFTVRTLIGAAGLSPSDAEMAELVAAYPGFKDGIESLYAVPETRYASPGLTFTATPIFADWAKS
jgi:hypothetical protein